MVESKKSETVLIGSSSNEGDVVINEVSINSSFIELYFHKTTDITDWSIFYESSGKSNSGSFKVCDANLNTTPCGTYSAGTFLLIRDFSLQNALQEILLVDNSSSPPSGNSAVHYFRYANNANSGGTWDWKTSDPPLSTIYYSGGTKKNLCSKPDGAVDVNFWQECSATPAASNEEVQIDHFQITHDGRGLTCAAETVTIKACANSDCSVLSTDSVTVDFQGDGVTKASPTFTGSTSVSFNHTTAETLTLSVANATITASESIVCDDGSGSSCDMSFTAAGFLLALDNHQSCTTPYLTIKAVRLSDSGLDCAPAYTGNQPVDFVFNYADPTSGETLPVLNGISMAANTVTQNRTVSFDGTGTASLSFNYQDAGQIRIDASDAAGVGLASASVITVVKPAKLIVTSSDTNADCTSGDATCFIFKVAGEEFNLNVTAACNDDDNTVTKNFEMNNIPLTVNTVAPNVGNSVLLGVTNINIEAADDGSHTINNQTISEVGVFTITAIPNDYFGETILAATSANIGRFIPAAFVLDSKFDGSLQVSPDAPSFAYIGQKDGSDGAIQYSLQPEFTIKAVNSDDVATKNYAVNDDSDAKKDFMTLITTQVSLAPITTDTVKKGVDDTLIDLDAVISGSLVGDSSTGLITFTMDTSNHFTYQHIANSKVDHFTADIDIIVNSINDGEGTLLADTNGVTAGVLKMDPDGVGVRFGRWYIENTYGPETSDLPLPMQIQHWDGGKFITNDLENFTAYDGIDEANYTKDTAGLNPALDISEVDVGGAGPLFSLGIGQLILEKPTDGSQGQIRLTYDIVPAWLKYDWDGDGNYDNNPSGVGVFGLFRGNDRIIYQREVNN